MARRSPPRPQPRVELPAERAYLDLEQALSAHGYTIITDANKQPIVYGNAELQPLLTKVRNRHGVIMYILLPADTFSHNQVRNGLYPFTSQYPQEIVVEGLEKIEIPRASLAANRPHSELQRFPLLTYQEATNLDASRRASELRQRLVNIPADQKTLEDLRQQVLDFADLLKQYKDAMLSHASEVERFRGICEKSLALPAAMQNLLALQMMDESRTSAIMQAGKFANLLRNEHITVHRELHKLEEQTNSLRQN